MSVFVKGVLIGLAIAVPVGPIGILCVCRTLAQGRAAGFVSGLGAASADAVYSSIAAFGLTFISVFLVDHEMWIRILGGLFLLYLGIRIFVAKPLVKQTCKRETRDLFHDYLSTFLLTLSNPMTFLTFIAIFAGTGLGRGVDGSLLSAGALVAGVFIGSALWWLVLSEGIGRIHKKIRVDILPWLNRAAGVILVGFSIVAFCGLLDFIG